MTVLLPTSGRSSFQRKNWGTAPQDTESVFLILLVKGEPARQADNTGLDAFCLEFLGGINRNIDFTTSADNSKGLILFLD